MRHDHRTPRPSRRPARGLLTAMALPALVLAGCAGEGPGTADPGEVGETATATTRPDSADGTGTAPDTAAGSAEEPPAAGELAFETPPMAYYAGDTVILGDPYPPMAGRPTVIAWRLVGTPDPAALTCSVTVSAAGDPATVLHEGEGAGASCIGDAEDAMGEDPRRADLEEAGEYTAYVTVTMGGETLSETVDFSVRENPMRG